MPSSLFPSIAITAGCVFSALSCEISAFAQTQPFSSLVEFQASSACPYTVPSAINRSGVITGSCSTGAGASPNGFIRDALGNVTIFNPPGSTGTVPVAINGQGFIVGSYTTAAGHTLGFVRAPDGAFTSFDFVEPQFPTLPTDINASGSIVGSVASLLSITGSLRSPNGTLTRVFVQGEKGTVPYNINEPGTITGVYYLGISDIPQGFVLAPNGTYTLFQAGFSGTIPLGINRSGTIAGFYLNLLQFPPDQGGFIRAPDGTITKFALPAGGKVPPGSGLLAFSKFESGGINAQGAVAGTYVDQNNIFHGFLRLPDGTLATIDLGAGNTLAVAINDLGEVIGSYQNEGKSVGYVALP